MFCFSHCIPAGPKPGCCHSLSSRGALSARRHSRYTSPSPTSVWFAPIGSSAGKTHREHWSHRRTSWHHQDAVLAAAKFHARRTCCASTTRALSNACGFSPKDKVRSCAQCWRAQHPQRSRHAGVKRAVPIGSPRSTETMARYPSQASTCFERTSGDSWTSI